MWGQMWPERMLQNAATRDREMGRHPTGAAHLSAAGEWMALQMLSLWDVSTRGRCVLALACISATALKGLGPERALNADASARSRFRQDVPLTASVLHVVSELGNVFGSGERLDVRLCALFQISRSRHSWMNHRRSRTLTVCPQIWLGCTKKKDSPYIYSVCVR